MRTRPWMLVRVRLGSIYTSSLSYVIARIACALLGVFSSPPKGYKGA